MIPKDPITIKINGFITDRTLNDFFEKYLPAFDYQVTSGYRSEQQNTKLREQGYSAAIDSSHMYNLARDFVLKNKQGRFLDDKQMRQVYNEFIKPLWPGYSAFTAKTDKTNTGWIHVNLNRDISKKYTQYAGLAFTALGLGLAAKRFYKWMNEKIST